MTEKDVNTVVSLLRSLKSMSERGREFFLAYGEGFAAGQEATAVPGPSG